MYPGQINKCYGDKIENGSQTRQDVGNIAALPGRRVICSSVQPVQMLLWLKQVKKIAFKLCPDEFKSLMRTAGAGGHTRAHTHTLLNCQQIKKSPYYLSTTAGQPGFVVIDSRFPQRAICLPHFHSSPLVGGEGHHLSQKLLDLPPREARASIAALQLAYGRGDRPRPHRGRKGTQAGSAPLG